MVMVHNGILKDYPILKNQDPATWSCTAHFLALYLCWGCIPAKVCTSETTHWINTSAPSPRPLAIIHAHRVQHCWVVKTAPQPKEKKKTRQQYLLYLKNYDLCVEVKDDGLGTNWRLYRGLVCNLLGISTRNPPFPLLKLLKSDGYPFMYLHYGL